MAENVETLLVEPCGNQRNKGNNEGFTFYYLYCLIKFWSVGVFLILVHKREGKTVITVFKRTFQNTMKRITERKKENDMLYLLRVCVKVAIFKVYYDQKIILFFFGFQNYVN